MYEAGTRGVWSIGEEYLLKELAIEEEIWGEQSWLGPEYAITRFLEANSKIPVVKYVKHWTDSEILAEEAADYLVELRSFTSDKLEAPGGDPRVLLDPAKLSHYRAEEKPWDCEDIAKRNREGIEKIEAEKKAIEDRIKTAEDRAKVAEEKLAENETIVAEFNKLSVEERENLKRRK
ncbi:hypothetical protein H4I95_08445 [Botrytis cinerea]